MNNTNTARIEFYERSNDFYCEATPLRVINDPSDEDVDDILEDSEYEINVVGLADSDDTVILAARIQ